MEPDAKSLIYTQLNLLGRRYHVQPPRVVFSYRLPPCYAYDTIFLHASVEEFINRLLFRDRIADARLFACYLTTHEFMHYLQERRYGERSEKYRWSSPSVRQRDEQRARHFGIRECGNGTRLDRLFVEYNELFRKRVRR